MRPGRAAVVTVLAVTPLASGCSSGDSNHGSQTTPGSVRFEGGRFPGELFVSIGAEGNGDLYHVRGSFSGARRLTVGARVSSVTAAPGALVISYAGGALGDRVSALDPMSGRPLPGPPIAAFGQAPELSASGRLTWTVPVERHGRDAGTRVMVSDAAGRARRVAYRDRSDLISGWGPGGELAIARDGAGSIVLDPGGSRQRALPTGLRAVYDWTTSERGDICALGPGGRIAFVRDGRRPRVVRSRWDPVAWSGDGRSLLAVTNVAVGLMSARNESVRRIASVSGGRIDVADWVDRR